MQCARTILNVGSSSHSSIMLNVILQSQVVNFKKKNNLRLLCQMLRMPWIFFISLLSICILFSSYQLMFSYSFLGHSNVHSLLLQIELLQCSNRKKHKVKVRIQLGLHGTVTVQSASVSMYCYLKVFFSTVCFFAWILFMLCDQLAIVSPT